MNTTAFLAFGLCTCAFIPQTASAADYEIDKSHAFAYFNVMHLGFAPSYGQFTKISGKIKFEPTSPDQSSITVDIDSSSVFTGNRKRDEHLRGPDFFDVKQYPNIQFRSSAWKKTDNKNFEVSGTLNLHGVSKPITVTMTQTGIGPDPWGNNRVGFTCAFEINRLDYGIKYMPDGLGKNVNIAFSVEGIQK